MLLIIQAKAGYIINKEKREVNEIMKIRYEDRLKHKIKPASLIGYPSIEYLKKRNDQKRQEMEAQNERTRKKETAGNLG